MIIKGMITVAGKHGFCNIRIEDGMLITDLLSDSGDIYKIVRITEGNNHEESDK